MPHTSDGSSSGDGLRRDLPQEITRRVREVCPDIPDDELAGLVDDVARVTLEHERDSSAALFGHIEPGNARNAR